MTEVSDGSFSGIDMKELMEIMDSDGVLINECFTDFIETWSVFLDDIKSAVAAGNARGLSQAAHSFKGSLQYLAATHAVSLVLSLESAGKSGDFSTVTADLGALETECRALERYMVSHLAG